MSRNPENWRRIFYFNRKDPRLLVPKFNPALGMTVNFANPFAYVTLGAIILIIIGFQYLIL